MNSRLFVYGLAIWLAATLALRFVGQRLLMPGNWQETLILFAISFPLMAGLVRRLCRHLPSQEKLAGGLSVALPTLLLDPFSSAFFSTVFPNMSPQVAGVFGGWMLFCCAGALLGVAIKQRPQS